MIQGLLGLLLIACGSVSYNGPGGYTGLFSSGSSDLYYHYGGAYSGFGGADGEVAQQLDRELQQLQRPPAQGAMAVGGALLALSSLGLVAGLLQLPACCPPWLLVEACLDIAAALALGPALALYYEHLSHVYASATCQERERLYRSKGYTGFGCSVHGAEVAAGLLAGGAIITFAASAVLAIRAFWALRKQRPKPHHPPAQQ